MTVAHSASISQGIAGRYAQAVFDIAREGGDLDKLASEIDDLSTALKDSGELRDLIASPMYSRDQQGRAIGAIAQKMGLGATLSNTLQLMAQNRRLFVLPQLAARLRDMIADARGEVTADVTSAVALTDEQKQRLTDTLAEKSGKKVKLNTRVDETLIGGMIVRLGSQMIDSSVRSKLASLQNAMKEVG
ncbi:MAG: F0F1 ATP synthase subunit delta [Paracoccus sp. (in: a-proteobacteria)]|uniref:F0F1 ATP synthase subunit delta n=1 Tax=Paracoccus sp. TaxID=267 RepID=UPI0026E09B85|nr:F0F1 ATP synthase subunit delta [Paracoccus sp. (in: a-proteobacteria)]MDO5613032.1 F0F1 ATP synthase subunit delta [Paracoccus sp. (in: a-proteobacteria)]MDO5632258.1 F0F1 ATP synthase subunit delta [Paracoccus sp. (in: a-proteobacteria)]